MNRLELKTWRRTRYLSQRELSEILGVRTNTVARWETGENDVPPYLHFALERLDQVYTFAPSGALRQAA